MYFCASRIHPSKMKQRVSALPRILRLKPVTWRTAKTVCVNKKKKPFQFFFLCTIYMYIFLFQRLNGCTSRKGFFFMAKACSAFILPRFYNFQTVWLFYIIQFFFFYIGTVLCIYFCFGNRGQIKLFVFSLIQYFCISMRF